MREKKEINIQTGEQVRLAREQARLTQEQLAERIEVSPQYISDLERGIVGISMATLKRLCLALSVSADQLLFGSRSQSQLAALWEKCRGLSGQQLRLLTQIVESYVEAVEADR